MFRTAVRYLRFKPEDGLHVVARGRLGVYEPKGEYQIVCEHMEPHGLGALQLAFEQLKKKLQAEGLFEPARKRPLPSLPRRIGIVTSLDGAALRDILKVLRRRAPNASVLIRPARVQGEDAAADVATAIRMLGKVPGVDVIIVGRGGGSIEDLWAFNEERVARAIVGLPGAGRLGRRPRSGLHDRRLRRRSPRADAVGGGGDGGRGHGRIPQPHRPARRPAARGRARRSPAAPRRGARAEQPPRAGRLRGARRRCAAVTRRSSRTTCDARCAAAIEARAREHRGVRQRLEQRDLRAPPRVHPRPPARPPKGGWPARRTRRVTAPTRASARSPAAWRTSVRSPSSDEAMLCAGTPTRRPSCAAPRRCRPAIASRSRSRTARSAVEWSDGPTVARGSET